MNRGAFCIEARQRLNKLYASFHTLSEKQLRETIRARGISSRPKTGGKRYHHDSGMPRGWNTSAPLATGATRQSTKQATQNNYGEAWSIGGDVFMVNVMGMPK